MISGYRCTLLFAIAVFLISGCASQGAKRLPADRFDYNAAIGSSAREQMLLNIVRSRYQEMPVFLEVSSVVAQYSYARSVGVGYFREFIGNSIAPTSDTASIDVNVGYSEFPTITYQPIQGESFARHLYSPVPYELFLAAVNSGWSIDLMMLIGVERFGAAENMSFGETRSAEQRTSDFYKLERFIRTLELLFLLADAELIEVNQVAGDEKTGTEFAQFLVIAQNIPEDLRPLVTEFRQLIGVGSSGNRFKITARTSELAADEISIQTRSVMAMMKFSARGVEIPAAHLEGGWVLDYGMQTMEGKERQFPFRVLSSKDRPKNVFAAVRHLDYWFYIDQGDIMTKRAFEHLMIFFQLKAPVSESTAPLLTLPTR